MYKQLSIESNRTDQENTNRRILVFDFDGVICNSIHDSFATALNTYINLKHDHNLPLKMSLASDEAIRFEKDFPGTFNSFSDLMPLANCAEDYLVLLSLIDQNRADQIHDQEDFDRLKKNFSSARLNEYHKAFYQIRSRMREENLGKWLNLLPPFPGMPDTIRELSNGFTLAISTSKDRPSVVLLLDRYGLSDCFKPENIFDKDLARNKRYHLIRLQKKHRLPFSRIHFIDDKVSHLLSVKDLGVHNYLACWGFNSEREVQIALKEGYTPIQLEDLKHLAEKLPMDSSDL
jgi:phosphoglycolate phosphatase-like HAD superfamily hydrolase